MVRLRLWLVLLLVLAVVSRMIVGSSAKFWPFEENASEAAEVKENNADGGEGGEDLGKLGTHSR
jgi:hypothetical protein